MLEVEQLVEAIQLVYKTESALFCHFFLLGSYATDFKKLLSNIDLRIMKLKSKKTVIGLRRIRSKVTYIEINQASRLDHIFM